MAKEPTEPRKLLAGASKPKKVRKRVTEIPQLDDDEIFAEVLREHFAEEQPQGSKPRKSRKTQKKSQRKWWWPKEAIPTDAERTRLLNKISAIYRANGYIRDGMPCEFQETSHLQKHLERLQAGLVPEITKKGILDVD